MRNMGDGKIESRMARSERAAATFATVAQAFRVLSDADRTAQLIAFGVLYRTGLRSMRERMAEAGRERVIATWGCTPDDLDREVQLLAERVHEEGRMVDGPGVTE